MGNEKLIKNATIIDRILKILQGFAAAGVIVAALFIPLTLIFGEKMIANADRLTIGELQLKLSGDMSAYLDMARIKSSIVVMLIGAILTAAAVWYCLRVLREIVAPMKEGQPFASGIADKIRKLGWTVLVTGAIAEIGGMITSIFELRAYQIDKIVSAGPVSEISYNYGFRLWFVFAALIIFFLSYVFRYGEALQKESDETL